MRPATRGFTLTELLMVLLIVGTVAAIGAPMLGPAARSGQLRGAAEAIADEVTRAHAVAVARQRCVALRLAEDRAELLIAEEGGCATAREWREVSVRSLRGFELSAVAAAVDERRAPEIVFDALGRLRGGRDAAPATTGRISIYGRGATARFVELTARGGTRVLEELGR